MSSVTGQALNEVLYRKKVNEFIDYITTEVPTDTT